MEIQENRDKVKKKCLKRSKMWQEEHENQMETEKQEYFVVVVVVTWVQTHEPGSTLCQSYQSIALYIHVSPQVHLQPHQHQRLLQLQSLIHDLLPLKPWPRFLHGRRMKKTALGYSSLGAWQWGLGCGHWRQKEAQQMLPQQQLQEKE